MMDTKTIKTISTQVYRKFPELSGVQPKVRQQQAKSAAAAANPTYVLTYNTRVEVGNGASLTRLVRVVATPEGSILKITTSK